MKKISLTIFLLLVLLLYGCKPSPPETGPDKNLQTAHYETYRSVPELLKQHQEELEKNLKYHKFFHGNHRLKHLALTFDDGPHPDYTPRILKILKKYNAKATFFLVGKKAEEHPELVKMILADGNNIGNHTYSHVRLTEIPEAQVAVEIKACGDVLKSITGTAPHLFRPPGGDYNRVVAETAEALGYVTVLWTDDPGDYARPDSYIMALRLMDEIDNGGIILVHDGVDETVDLLPKFLEYMESKGYEFITIDKMMDETPGFDY